MSIVNVLLTRDHLVVAVDTLAEDALTRAHSVGAKLLLIPQHNVVLATRGSTQFFLRIYELALQASFRADFTMEQLSAELGLVVDQLWPNYEKAAAEAGLQIEQPGTELVLGGWSPKERPDDGHGICQEWQPTPLRGPADRRPASVAWRTTPGCDSQHGSDRSIGPCASSSRLPQRAIGPTGGRRPAAGWIPAEGTGCDKGLGRI